MCLRTETLEAFGAAPGQQATARLGGHASTEAVGAGAVQIAGVECTFHSIRTRASSRKAGRVLSVLPCVNRRILKLELDSLPFRRFTPFYLTL